MKILLTILIFCSLSTIGAEHNWYRFYLLSKIEKLPKYTNIRIEGRQVSIDPIPRFERPKGAIFCRMEDYLTAKTKVWIKVGVK